MLKEPIDLEPYVGMKVRRKGITWIFSYDSMAGTYFFFNQTNEYQIYATIGYEGSEGIPLEIVDGKSQMVDFELIERFPEDWEEYIDLVFTEYEEIMDVKIQ